MALMTSIATAHNVSEFIVVALSLKKSSKVVLDTNSKQISLRREGKSGGNL